MADPLTAAADAISAASPRIRAFAQLAAQRIIALEHPAPPPSPVAGDGLILFRYGSSWAASPAAGYERYGVVVVGYGNDGDAGRLTSAHGCAYRTSIECDDVPVAALSAGGVTVTQARAANWLLLSDAGTELTVPRWGQHVCDPGSVGYQVAWCATVKARLAAANLRYLFLDNVTGAPWFTARPALYPTDAGWQDAYLSMLAAQRAALPGVYLLANVGDAPDRVAWWRQVAPHVDGLMVEGFDGSLMHHALIRTAQAAGRDAYALVYGDPASAQVRSLAQSFRSVWNGKGGGFGVNSSGVDPWNANWTQP